MYVREILSFSPSHKCFPSRCHSTQVFLTFWLLHCFYLPQWCVDSYFSFHVNEHAGGTLYLHNDCYKKCHIYIYCIEEKYKNVSNIKDCLSVNTILLCLSTFFIDRYSFIPLFHSSFIFFSQAFLSKSQGNQRLTRIYITTAWST